MLAWTRLKKRWLIRRLLNRRSVSFIEDVTMSKRVSTGVGCVKSAKKKNKVKSTILRRLLRTLTLEELHSLWMAVRSRGAHFSDCIVVPKRKMDVECGDKTEMVWTNPLVLCFRAYFEPNIAADDLLSRMIPLSWCHLSDNNDNFSTSAMDRTFLCCNPYHYGIMVIDVASYGDHSSQPLINQTNVSGSDKVEKGRRETDNDTGFCSRSTTWYSLATSIDHEEIFRFESSYEETRTRSGTKTRPWCHMAYWEENRRVGPLLPVIDSAGFVYFDPPSSSWSIGPCNLCIRSICESDQSSSSIIRTRMKIGLGLALFIRNGRIWLYNRSEHCIFVRSNTRLANRCQPLRVNPKHCCVVHQVGDLVGSIDENSFKEAPTVLISFGKGWGPSYVRSFITCCPCWVQVIFST